MLNNVLYTCEAQIDANGIKINFDSFGESSHPPIILIMGLATQMIVWDDDFCRLLASKGYWVIRFDNRDVGKSTWLTEHNIPSVSSFVMNVLFGKKLKVSYRLGDMAADVLGLMDSLNIKQTHLVGASMGGMIAQLVAIQAPERLLSLTSIMSTTGNRKLPRVSNRTALKLFVSPANNLDAYVKHAREMWQILHGDYYPFTRDDITNLLIRSHKRGLNPAGFNRQMAAILDSRDRTAELQKLNLPTLVVHGAIDPLIPVECGIATAKAIQQAKLIIYPSMGHTLPKELHQDLSQQIAAVAQKAG